MRRVAVLGLACLIAVLVTDAPAGAKAPTLKRQFAPLDTRIQNIGEDAGATLSVSSAWTYAHRASEWGSLATRTIAVSQAVGTMTGAKGPLLVRQRKLQLALAQGASDLSALATAARLHSAREDAAARKALLKDSPPIDDLRSALSQALGLGK